MSYSLHRMELPWQRSLPLVSVWLLVPTVFRQNGLVKRRKRVPPLKKNPNKTKPQKACFWCLKLLILKGNFLRTILSPIWKNVLAENRLSQKEIKLYCHKRDHTDHQHFPSAFLLCAFFFLCIHQNQTVINISWQQHLMCNTAVRIADEFHREEEGEQNI